MGSIEKAAKRQKTRNDIQQAVLAVVGAAGIMTAAILAPNVFQALPHVMGKRRYKLALQTRTALGRLIAKGEVRRNSRGQLELTVSGRRALSLAQARASAPASRKRRWDKQYRLVMFDIPQRRKSTRDRLRMLMKDFGFLRLQNSVWVSPYDCEDLIALVKADLRVGTDILYAVVRQIENDALIKRHFKLS